MGRFIKPKAITRKQFYKYLLDNFYISETLAELLAVYAEDGYLTTRPSEADELYDIIIEFTNWDTTDLGTEFWVHLFEDTPGGLRKSKF